MKDRSNQSQLGSYSIGELGKSTGVKVVTIRYYEKIGMLPNPPRSEGGQRVYSHNHLRQLTFIRRSRELGFSLSEIRALLKLEESAGFSCEDVKALTMEHVRGIQEKIADLKRMERILKDLASQCEKGSVSECPILDTLASA